jgi:murein DD-endopeptidase MepM/ murein hydrolase activator NlpD
MRKHTKPSRKRQQSGTKISRYLGRLFSPRNIIIISEHKTEHVPLSMRKQLFVTLGILGLVGSGSYLTGDYMAAQETLREKEQMIANSHLKNRRIEGEFALLKRDLVSMLDQEKPEELGEYATFIIQQYRDNGNSLEDIDVDLSQLSSHKHGAVFDRIAFLEQTVEDIKHEHETIIAAIEETAQGRLGDLEHIVKLTGVDLKKAESIVSKSVKEDISGADGVDDSPRGGPYDSVNENLLKSYNKGLYSNLKRLVVLDELVNFMPLADPMRDYRITSGYGVRLDPFKKRPASHHGIDFAGPAGAKIYSANDGVVKRAGRVGAYGLLVEIDHGASISTRYGHLSKILVEKGQKIRKGQVIGVQGSTGRSTGAHLHYEVRFQGATINPKNFLKAGKHVRTIEEKNRGQN